ncbi:hypothetical protein PR001_g30992 [Phytophthora rubi]|uniref:Uncharacterized protein n=1 Tax=Phytophthora rubi TaxID=129364 RepID=A0A6A3GRZ4_9STRA|nr:hypothetical protein PR001_g30992 [Phytophthora rubi]
MQRGGSHMEEGMSSRVAAVVKAEWSRHGRKKADCSGLCEPHGPPHPRGGRCSFNSSSYSSGFADTDSLCGFNSSQLFDDSDGRNVNVDDVVNSSHGDYALLSMPRVGQTGGAHHRRRHASESQTHPLTTDDLIKEVKLAFEEMTAGTLNKTFPSPQAMMERITRFGGSNNYMYKLGYMHKDKLLRAASHCIHFRHSRVWPQLYSW